MDFQTNISQNLVDTQNEMRKGFEELKEEFARASEAYERLQIMLFEEQKTRTRLESDLQVAKFSIRSLQEDVKDIQERLQEEFKPKKSLFSFFKT